MKKTMVIMAVFCLAAFGAKAQKFALIDMEYILKNIPAYEMANEQLKQVSTRWQREIETKAKEAETLFNNYKSEQVYLSKEQQSKKEEEVVAKEKEVAELRRKYFGPEGELFKKRESLMQPIQDDIYNAVKKISEEKGYQMIVDRASDASIIFASPRIDISNEVLTKLGYSK
ncbi:MAG: OmpH family outer membrane protein [Coprobacter sp.]|nr:OmpH family outer membrane protein [Coprobacter sp.]